MVRNAGQDFCMSDERILEINSPRPDHKAPDKASVTGGPYVVVYKNPGERWAIVAFDWGKGKRPHLGFRWFTVIMAIPRQGGLHDGKLSRPR